MRAVRTAAVSVAVVLVVLGGIGVRVVGGGLAWSTSVEAEPAGSPGRSAYAEPGDRAVGLRNVRIDGERTIHARLWYPARPSEGGSTAYAIGIKALGSTPFALATYRGGAQADADADGSGPYPLVILSPGFAFHVDAYAWLAEHLASHGFVVLGLDHDELLDPSLLWRATVDRPRDAMSAIDHADAAVRAGTWADLVDPERIAVVGHSYGGYTALAAAGARLDTDRLGAICAEVAATDPIRLQCDALVPNIGAMARAAGLDSAPPGRWPSWGDGRVDAAVAIAGDAVMFGEHGMSSMTAPVLAIGGTADRDAPFAWGTRLAYERGMGARRVEVALDGAEHLVFTGPCELRRMLLAAFPEPFCADPAWERAAAHDVVRHTVTAFLLAELAGDGDAARALDPDAPGADGMRLRSIGY